MLSDNYYERTVHYVIEDYKTTDVWPISNYSHFAHLFIPYVILKYKLTNSFVFYLIITVRTQKS